MPATVDTGIVLISSWVITMGLYLWRMPRIMTNYHKSIDHTNAAARNLFYVSESVVTVGWLCLSFIFLLTDVESFLDHNAPVSLLVCAVIFGTGAILWPLAIEDYSSPKIRMPWLEDMALLITASGASSLCGVVWHNRSSDVWSLVAGAIATHMAFHFVVVDLVGWSIVRRRIYYKKRREAVSIQLISQEWGPLDPPTVMRVS